MATIELTRGFSTIVDDEWFEELNSYNWYASGPDGRPARRLRLGPRKLIYMYHQILHVLPWVLSSLGLEVDHDNQDPLDNRALNLKIVTHKQNMQNSLRHNFAVGVCLDNTHNKWKAYLDRIDMPRLNIGTFVTEEEAYKALQDKKTELGLESN